MGQGTVQWMAVVQHLKNAHRNETGQKKAREDGLRGAYCIAIVELPKKHGLLASRESILRSDRHLNPLRYLTRS